MRAYKMQLHNVLHDKRYKCIPVCSAYMHMKQLVFTCKEISGNLYGITIAFIEMQSFLPVAFLLSEASMKIHDPLPPAAVKMLQPPRTWFLLCKYVAACC